MVGGREHWDLYWGGGGGDSQKHLDRGGGGDLIK